MTTGSLVVCGDRRYSECMRSSKVVGAEVLDGAALAATAIATQEKLPAEGAFRQVCGSQTSRRAVLGKRVV
jgi:hypothetical protein